MAASKNVASRSALERALDKALDIPAARIEERIARMRHDRPGADNAELVEMAASRFRTEAGLSSGAVGASAAFPAVGAGTALGVRENVRYIRGEEGSAMTTVTATAARSDLYRLIDAVNEDSSPITITGRRGNAVLIGEDDWSAIQETLYLQGVPGMADSLKAAAREDLDDAVDDVQW